MAGQCGVNMLSFIVLFLCISCSVVNSSEFEATTADVEVKTNFTRPGVCPKTVIDGRLECFNLNYNCEFDSDCDEDQKCCDQGCGNSCIYPSFSGCQQLRSLLSKHLADFERTENTHVPKCKDDGSFEDIQCDQKSGNCWCVDDLGFERGGTRKNSYGLVNCSAPNPCAGVLCRMLCPYGFQLDSEGCPLCLCLNPCEGVVCPAGQKCEIEEIPCSGEMCPPLPTCKKARDLDMLCPIGEPLSSPDSGTPFFCGVTPNEPQCPLNYACDVLRGNAFGVCCPLVDKVGECPKELHAGESCRKCKGDMECDGVNKCCEIEGCGLTCTKPANTTLCRQQKEVVELLLSGSRGYAGYVPQCLPDGEFSPKQCSSNDKLCWCVTETGVIISATFGPKDKVECPPKEEQSNVVQGRAKGEELPFACEKLSCEHACEAGYKYDGKGCKTCECAKPCEDISCPDGLDCILVKTDDCFDDNCIPIATCRDTAIHCQWGKALRDNNTGAVVQCKENGCPGTHVCELRHDSSICCPKKIEIEHTKSSECPDYIYESDQCDAVCHSDSECEGELKCCESKACGAICVPPKPPRMQTMCEYIRDAGVTIEKDNGNATLAIPVPQCLPDGLYRPKQCDEKGDCWCVDEFGVEMINTRIKSDIDQLNCEEIREEMHCLGLTCRLGCDFGFVMDDVGCPLCHCRNPCQNASCGPDKTCQFITAPCDDDWCPPLPYCVPRETSARTFPECPSGSSMLLDYDDEPVKCDPFSKFIQCPYTHNCVVNNPSEMGVCCPDAAEHNVPDDVEKIGQCPYLIPVEAKTCGMQCSFDSECDRGRKCCSNGCGTVCVEPVLKTACQHLKAALEFRAAENGIPASRVFMPNCTSDGEFGSIQCDPVAKSCWCVDKSGSELPGTREETREEITCIPNIDNCTPLYCEMSCPHGYELDKHGCPLCDCKNPCKGVKCKVPYESCRLAHVNCLTEPCPPVPLCLPDAENPCPVGEPLRHETFGDIVDCSPQGEMCPSSHRCHLSPLKEYAVCCPVPINSTCELLKKKNLQLRKSINKVTFVPKCSKTTGEWDPVQCMESLGLCWCVDKEGSQLPGTLVRGAPPQCTARTGKSNEITPICANGTNVHLCPENLCKGKICLSYPNATCNVDPCGGCKVQFFDDYSNLVDCNAGLTACFAEVQKVINSNILKSRDNFDDNDILPQLEEVMEEMFSPPPVYPPPPPPPHYVKRRQAVFDYDYESRPLPSYDYDIHSYEDVDLQGIQTSIQPVVIVPKVKRIEIRIRPQFVSQPLQVESRMAPVFEPLLMESVRELADMVPHVEVLGTTQRFTIMDDGEFNFAVKSGSCPVPSLLSMLRSASQGCTDQCYGDRDCPGALKCCLYRCGFACVRPFHSRVEVPGILSKAGECPAGKPVARNPFACLFVRHMCSTDQDCAGDKKCCLNSCGFQCKEVEVPQKEPEQDVNPVTLQAAAPKCSLEGGYAITQKQGELSWCVDQFGNPLHHTLTRGTVDCNANGTVISQIIYGPVCSNVEKTPLVCKDQCLNAVCPQHPEAICVADPCDECSVKFVTSDGTPVNCEEKCKQPVIIGNCRNTLSRYYFDQKTKKCKWFPYGGCEGNDNNFETLDSCVEECEREAPVCEQPKEFGLCRARMYRWFYNKNTHQCQEFVYGGCGGNSNNFESRIKCEQTCPDLILCPWASVEGQNLTPCSRSVACTNLTCPGNEDAICTVDPCLCKAFFADKTGKPVKCFPKEEEQIAEETSASLRTAALSLQTRCQSLRKRHLLSADAVYIPQCSEDGQFYPVQCSREKEPKCWCVDEAGMQLASSTAFAKGTKSCRYVKIKKVEVTLAFKQSDSSYSEVMKPAIKRLIEQFLRDLKAESTEVTVTVHPSDVHVLFTLLGDNKVQVAYQLEEMMRLENIFIILPKAQMSGDYRASYFYHELDYSDENVDNGIAANRINSHAGSDYNWTLFAVFLAVGCLVLFLLFYVVPAIIRRRNKEKDITCHEDPAFHEDPKPSLIRMVFHNVTYGVTGKKAKKPEEDPEVPKVVVQTVEAEYESIQKKDHSGDSEAPPAYDDVSEKEKEIDGPDKH